MTSLKRSNNNNDKKSLDDNCHQIKKNKTLKEDEIDVKKFCRKILPVLPEEHVKDMIAGSRGFYGSHFRNSNKIPYVLPFDRTKLVCICGKVFPQKYGRSFYNHSLICLHVKGSLKDQQSRNAIIEPLKNVYTHLLEEEDAIPIIQPGSTDLHTLPRFCSIRGNLCLQLLKTTPIVSCICGHHESYHKIYGNHMVRCEYVCNMIRKHAPTTQILQSDIYGNKPFLVEYCSQNPHKKNELAFNDLKKKNGMRCFLKSQPLSHNCFRFYRPDCKQQCTVMDWAMKQLTALEYYAKDLELILINHFDDVAKIVYECTDGRKVVAENMEGKSDHFEVQRRNDHFEVQLISAEKFSTLSSSFFQTFCHKYNYDYQHFSAMVNFAKYTTMQDIGKKEFENGQISNPILTFNRSTTNFGTRVSEVSNNFRHYGMILSFGGSSVIIHKQSIEKKIYTIEQLNKELFAGISKNNNVIEKSTDALRSLIERLPCTSRTRVKLANGCGNLFGGYIGDSTDQHQENNFDRLKITECMPGSFYSIADGIVHSVSECTLGRTEIHLCWTFSQNISTKSKGSKIKVKYETKLTMLIHLAYDIWRLTGTNKTQTTMVIDARIQLLWLLCEAWHISCGNEYCFIPEEYTHSNINTLLEEIDQHPQQDEFLLTLCTEYAEKENLFDMS